jgi:hypothetical protein
MRFIWATNNKTPRSNGLVKVFVVSALEREKGTDACVEYQLETVIESEKYIAWTRAVRLRYLFEVQVHRRRDVAGSFVKISGVRGAFQENTIQRRGQISKGRFIVGQKIKYKNL